MGDVQSDLFCYLFGQNPINIYIYERVRRENLVFLPHRSLSARARLRVAHSYTLGITTQWSPLQHDVAMEKGKRAGRKSGHAFCMHALACNPAFPRRALFASHSMDSVAQQASLLMAAQRGNPLTSSEGGSRRGKNDDITDWKNQFFSTVLFPPFLCFPE